MYSSGLDHEMSLESQEFELVDAVWELSAELSSMASAPVWLSSSSIARTLSTRASASQSVLTNSLLDKFEGLLIQCTMLQEEGQYDGAAEVVHQCRVIFKQQHDIISTKKSSCIQFCQCYAAHKLHTQNHLSVAVKYLIKSLQYAEDDDNDDYILAVVQDVITLLNHGGLYLALHRWKDKLNGYQLRSLDSDSWTRLFDACWVRDDVDGMTEMLRLIREIKGSDRNLCAVGLVSQIKYDIYRAKYRSEYERIIKVLQRTYKQRHTLNNTEYESLLFYMDIKRGNMQQCMEKLDNGWIDVNEGNIALFVKAAVRWSEKTDFNVLKLYDVIFRTHACIWKDNRIILFFFAKFCWKFEHYILCKKMLHLASKISPTKSIQLQMTIDKILDSLKCDYCGRNQAKVKVCSGCGKVYFCGRKCQKQLWRKTHHRKCDKKWLDCMRYLKPIM
eukprot:495189_1